VLKYTSTSVTIFSYPYRRYCLRWRNVLELWHYLTSVSSDFHASAIGYRLFPFSVSSGYLLRITSLTQWHWRLLSVHTYHQNKFSYKNSKLFHIPRGTARTAKTLLPVANCRDICYHTVENEFVVLKTGKVYSLEDTDITKAFFTPFHGGRCCTKAIRGNCCHSCTDAIPDHCCVLGNSCTNEIPNHWCATMSSNNDLRRVLLKISLLLNNGFQ
jgi:hypothetical protein